MAFKDPTEYGFGQLGSMFTDTTDPIYPPKEMVFVAITFLEDSTVAASGGLTADVSIDKNYKTEYIGDTILAHDTGDTQSTGNCDGDTLTITSANLDIKVGMTVEGASIGRSLTAPAKVRVPVPVVLVVSFTLSFTTKAIFISSRHCTKKGEGEQH